MLEKSIVRLFVIVAVVSAVHFTQTVPSALAADFSFNSIDTPVGASTAETSTISVTGADGLAITDINVTVNTTTVPAIFTNNVELSLEDVNSGTSIVLADSGITTGNTITFNAVTFDDQATGGLPPLVAPPLELGPGSFQPDPGSLADFNGSNFNDGDWQLTATGTEGGLHTINSWTLDVTTAGVAAVPEPGTYAMFATILAGAGFMVIRNRRKKVEEESEVSV